MHLFSAQKFVENIRIDSMFALSPSVPSVLQDMAYFNTLESIFLVYGRVGLKLISTFWEK
jgi:hypothetical protein